MLDLDNERLLTLAEASKRLPNRPSLCSLWRWCERGVGGVKLEFAKVGGARFTSVEALQRFTDRLTAARTGEKPATNPKRKRRADEELVKAGW